MRILFYVLFFAVFLTGCEAAGPTDSEKETAPVVKQELYEPPTQHEAKKTFEELEKVVDTERAYLISIRETPTSFTERTVYRKRDTE